MPAQRLLSTFAALAALTLAFATVQPAAAATPATTPSDTALVGASTAPAGTPDATSRGRPGAERGPEVIVDPAVKLCRRVANAGEAAPQHLVERCRAWLAGSSETGTTAAQLCRRVANAGEAAPQHLIERCRTWLNGQGDASTPIAPAAACRRIASADQVAPHLIERCRTWLNGLGGDTPERPERERSRR